MMIKKHILLLSSLVVILILATVLIIYSKSSSEEIKVSGESISVSDLENYYLKGDYDAVIANAEICEDKSLHELERLDCHRYLQGAYIKKGEYLKAAEVCKDSLKISLDVNDVRFCAALIEKAEGQDSAIEFWKEYQKEFPRTAEVDVEGLRSVKGTGKLFYPWFR